MTRVVTRPGTFPPGTTALLSIQRATFPGSGTQRWMTVKADGQARFSGVMAGAYVLRVGGQIIPVTVPASGDTDHERATA